MTNGRTLWRCAAAARRTAVAAALLWPALAGPGDIAAAEPDLFKQAVDYMFTGRVDPPEGAEIVDRKRCVVIVPDTRFDRFARYYLGRLHLDDARVITRYSGPRARYDLDVRGDEVVLEYLRPDKTTVIQGYRSAQIALPGEINATQKALKIIADHCKTESDKVPF